MSDSKILDIDPRTLHLPGSQLSGADPVKLFDQMRRFGSSIVGMPPVQAYRGSDGAIVIYDGVTRATRVARLLPGQTIPVEIIRTLSRSTGHLPLLGDQKP